MELKEYFNLVDRNWEKESYNPMGNAIWKVPSMLIASEKRLLSYLTEKVYSGEGKVLDLGCFLGGSTAFLAHGLSQNTRYKSTIEVFDLFHVSNFEKKNFFPKHNLAVPEDLDTIHLFRDYLKPFLPDLNIHKGNILEYHYPEEKIEILFIDLMKSYKIYDHVITEFFGHLIPMKSIIILQDYYFHNSGPWHHVLTYLLRDKLRFITDTRINSAVFLCTKKITQTDIEKCLWKNISFDQKMSALLYAYEMCSSERQRNILKNVLKLTSKGKNEGIGLNYNTL